MATTEDKIYRVAKDIYALLTFMFVVYIVTTVITSARQEYKYAKLEYKLTQMSSMVVKTVKDADRASEIRDNVAYWNNFFFG